MRRCGCLHGRRVMLEREIFTEDEKLYIRAGDTQTRRERVEEKGKGLRERWVRILDAGKWEWSGHDFNTISLPLQPTPAPKPPAKPFPNTHGRALYTLQQFLPPTGLVENPTSACQHRHIPPTWTFEIPIISSPSHSPFTPRTDGLAKRCRPPYFSLRHFAPPRRRRCQLLNGTLFSQRTTTAAPQQDWAPRSRRLQATEHVKRRWGRTSFARYDVENLDWRAPLTRVPHISHADIAQGVRKNGLDGRGRSVRSEGLKFEDRNVVPLPPSTSRTLPVPHFDVL
ncbi:hypothetical protein SCHPADRAFT_891151 [Schizopora paradoxa]|uniref:Uncharacterized protein n=1 Tax=Schizopora paradoxa TaxID=27342 RepID=A0A0H2RK40_9AGAM|nr:hypothetical protein SCHPADRAFT_891151 [Schizopora paradoxa]